MIWYWHRWWRVTLSPSRQGTIWDSAGRWRHVIGPVWWLTDPAPTIAPRAREGEG
jgi:hypothetical protein